MRFVLYLQQQQQKEKTQHEPNKPKMTKQQYRYIDARQLIPPHLSKTKKKCAAYTTTQLMRNSPCATDDTLTAAKRSEHRSTTRNTPSPRYGWMLEQSLQQPGRGYVYLLYIQGAYSVRFSDERRKVFKKFVTTNKKKNKKNHTLSPIHASMTCRQTSQSLLKLATARTRKKQIEDLRHIFVFFKIRNTESSVAADAPDGAVLPQLGDEALRQRARGIAGVHEVTHHRRGLPPVQPETPQQQTSHAKIQ